jgi:hypothetical protein
MRSHCAFDAQSSARPAACPPAVRVRTTAPTRHRQWTSTHRQKRTLSAKAGHDRARRINRVQAQKQNSPAENAFQPGRNEYQWT